MSRENRNPALSSDIFSDAGTSDRSMTIQGTAFKTLLLVMIVFVGGVFSWTHTMGYSASFEVVKNPGYERLLTNVPGSVYGWLSIGAIGGFLLGLFVIFNPRTSPF